MNRKTIILCISVIAVLFVGIAVAVFFLYSGQRTAGGDSRVSLSDARDGLFLAVPADAVAVMRFDSARKAVGLASGTGTSSVFPVFPEKNPFNILLLSMSKLPQRSAVSGAPAVVSIHGLVSLEPLLVLDAARSGAELPEDFVALVGTADSLGLYHAVIDCSADAAEGTYISKRTLLVISTSELLVKSSQRHIASHVSILDSEGFADVASSVQGKDRIFLSHANSRKTISGAMSSGYRKYSDFFRRVADWTGFAITDFSHDRLTLSGSASYGNGSDYFMNALSSTSSSEILSVLPSYTVFAATLPLQNAGAYVDAYEKFADAGIGIGRYRAKQKSVAVPGLPAPKQWAESIGLKEAAVASFRAGSSLEKVLLLKTSGRDPEIISGGAVTSFKGYVPHVHEFVYKGYASSLFGSLFSLPDESFCTYIDGWIVAGSRNAVDEYVSGRALEVSLKTFISDSGLAPDVKNTSFLSYFSFTEDEDVLQEVFGKSGATVLASSFNGTAYAPVFFKIGRNGEMSLSLDRVAKLKSKAPAFERDTVVTVPAGPFRVKNSGTGRMNLFCQQPNNYLCLQEEDGKGIWGVEFKSPICGRASTIDYYANGKLQIIFASGSKLYLIDRLGRFVSPFPVDLGKDILLGPDVYDFNGTRKYNALVLHKDNTIQMYNLQGRSPEQWKGITAPETIKDLPEAVKAGGKTYWAVRTSIRTLIYPFYGGEPLTAYEGDKMIRPDSKIVPVEGKSAVKAVSYDGKTITIDLK